MAATSRSRNGFSTKNMDLPTMIYHQRPPTVITTTKLLKEPLRNAETEIFRFFLLLIMLEIEISVYRNRYGIFNTTKLTPTTHDDIEVISMVKDIKKTARIEYWCNFGLRCHHWQCCCCVLLLLLSVMGRPVEAP